MQLLAHGFGVQRKEWHVCKQSASGFFRVYYILSGEVTYRDAELEKRLEHRKLYVFPARTAYRIDHDPDRPIECLWFHMDLFPYDVSRLLELDPTRPDQETLRALLDALCYEISGNRKKEKLCFVLAEALSLLICRDPSVRRPDPVLVRILEYVRENLSASTLNVADVSQHFGYSTAHFIRFFREKVGMTPYHYISTLRLSAAAKLLSKGQTVCEVAASCGYADVKTFSRAFKKSYGVAPSLYVGFYRPQA